jgi:hypothetical protein
MHRFPPLDQPEFCSHSLFWVMHEINKRQSLYSATRVVFPADVSMAQASAGKERAGRRSRFACDRNVSLFVAAPFLDRSLQRSPPRRPLAIGGFYIVLGGMVSVGVFSQIQGRRNPALAA